MSLPTCNTGPRQAGLVFWKYPLRTSCTVGAAVRFSSMRMESPVNRSFHRNGTIGRNISSVSLVLKRVLSLSLSKNHMVTPQGSGAYLFPMLGLKGDFRGASPRALRKGLYEKVMPSPRLTLSETWCATPSHVHTSRQQCVTDR